MKTIIPINELKAYSNADLLEKLKNNFNFTEEELANLELAFEDIFESSYNIFFNLLPTFINSQNKDEIEDLFVEMKTEFEHIKYHIKDAKLYNLDAD